MFGHTDTHEDAHMWNQNHIWAGCQDASCKYPSDILETHHTPRDASISMEMLAEALV